MEKLLTIAGSDCSGGAGIQADLKTFAAHKTYGMSVIVALTAQNTMGVTGIHKLDRDFVEEQLDRVFEDIYPDAIKIGMVSDGETILAIRKKLLDYGAKNIVVDPVMVATSGSSLLDPEATKALVDGLLPLARIITPNMAEASVLSGIEVVDKKSMEEAAEIIGRKLDGYVLVKGGHLEDSADDLVYHKGDMLWIEGERYPNKNTHGTGCTLSSAIAVNLAKGMEVEEAIRRAKDYLTGAIREDFDLGQGPGPLNHMYKIKEEE